ncbi:DUF7541 family protein [Natrialba aegyptia]|uniref:Cox cluster protein n=1 Tax=Natrialba aegyptia DSM 13077 TaxID=1227491 RepID=M0BEE1_9EURY|nr:hypothetical protein [Natrialba aegyptia]ELZ09210.1 hypothetical protein C480_02373 [Natrialba aegyptia DSM 13077]
MGDHSAHGTGSTTTSPWPLLVALGLVFSEVGIVVALLPVAVAGLVLFAASVTGFLTESARVARPWSLAIGFGIAFVVFGGLLYALGTGTLSVAPADELTGLARRGIAIAAAGVITAVGAVALRVRSRRNRERERGSERGDQRG